MGVAIDIAPRDALSRELCCTAGNVAFYQALVNELPVHPERDVWVPGEDETPGHWKWGKTGLYGPIRLESGIQSGRALPHVLVELLDRERKHLVVVALAAARAGVDERRVQLEEERGRMIAELFRNVFEDADLKLSDKQRRQGIATAAKHLRLIAVGGERIAA